jgi:NarL family two-component system response regulator LiaR
VCSFTGKTTDWQLSETAEDTMSKIRILLADDHALVREGTRELLEREEDFVVISEAGDGAEAVELAAAQPPDVIIMDIAMPVLNGIEATRQIKAICPSTAVLVLTAYDDDQYIFALLEAGAAGYLLKNVRADELVSAVRAVYAGESVLHPTIARKVINHYARPSSEESDTDLLTERELEVLKLAAKGMSNREIAQELVLSVRTVQVHLTNIFGKLDVGSRTEAVMCGLRRGWIKLEDTV